MPVYNAAAYLAEAIDSVLNQTHQEIELIIINDGSTDESEDIIKNYNDLRIKYYYQKNKGQAIASNFGIEKASGDYIKFFDADDVLNIDHLHQQLIAINENATTIVSCDWGRFYKDYPNKSLFNEDIVRQELSPINWLKETLNKPADMMAAWLWLIPKQVLQKAGGWNTTLTLNNDFEFSIRLLLNADKVVHAGKAKLYYRSGVQGTLSKKISEQAFYQAFLSTHLGCNLLLKADNSAAMKRICANRYQVWVHRIYPKHPALINKFQQQVNELGGSDLPLEGGKLLFVINYFFGWKTAKKTKYFIYRFINKQDDLSCLPT